MTRTCERCMCDQRKLLHPEWQCRTTLDMCEHCAMACTKPRGHGGSHAFMEWTCTRCGASPKGAR